MPPPEALYDASKLATILLQQSQGFSLCRPQKNSLAAGNLWGDPQNRRKLAATTAVSHHSRALSRPQRPRDTKLFQRLWIPSPKGGRLPSGVAGVPIQTFSLQCKSAGMSSLIFSHSVMVLCLPRKQPSFRHFRPGPCPVFFLWPLPS